MHDAEVAQRLLYHLARAFGCPDAAYLAGPMRIQRGFDAAIFGFTLDRFPPPLVRGARRAAAGRSSTSRPVSGRPR
jgi:hypothetical protein